MAAAEMSATAPTVLIRLKCGVNDVSLRPAHGVQLSVPQTLGRKGLRNLVLHLLDDPESRPDLHFLAADEPLRTTLANFLTRRKLSAEATLDLTYYLPLPSPRPDQPLQASEDWLSAIDAASVAGEAQPLVLVASYSGRPSVFRGEETVISEDQVTADAHATAIKGVAWLPGCENFVSASSDQTVKLWSLRDGAAHGVAQFRSEEAGPPVAFESVATQAGVSPAVAMGGADGSVWVIADALAQLEGRPVAAAGGKRKAPDGVALTASKLGLTSTDLSVSSVQWSGKDVVTSGWDGLVRVWDVDGCATKVTIPSGGKPVTSVSVADTVMLVSAVDGAIRLVDAREGKGVVAACGRKGAHWGVVTDACWMAEGKSAVSGGVDGSVRLWDVRALMTPAHIMERVHAGVKSLAVAAAGGEVFSAGADGKVARFRV